MKSKKWVILLTLGALISCGFQIGLGEESVWAQSQTGMKMGSIGIAGNAAKSPQSDFVLGPEDIVKITVWGAKELTSAMPIRPDGFISFPLIGDIKAQGLTPGQLKKEIARQLKDFINEPNVVVIVEEINSINISIAGEVKKPGVFKANRAISLLHLFSMAQGFTEDADLHRSYVLRDGKKIDVQIFKLVEEDDFSQNIWLKGNDLVYIHTNFQSQINITGEVKEPQIIPFQEGMTFLDAVMSAKGLTEIALPEGAIIYRQSQNDTGEKLTTKIPVALNKVISEGDLSKDIALMPGDIIHVPKNFQTRVNIIGEVEKPQILDFEEGMTLLDAVLLAGGLTEIAQPSGAKIYRKIEKEGGKKVTSKIQVKLDDVIEKGDLSKNILLKPGDIIHIPRAFF